MKWELEIFNNRPNGNRPNGNGQIVDEMGIDQVGSYCLIHLLPLDKWDWCKTGTLNVWPWVIKVIVNRRF